MEARAAAAPTYVRRESAPRRAWAWLKKRALNIYAGFAIAYLLIPIAVIIAFSFNNPAGKYNFTWEGFTLKHWADVFSLPDSWYMPGSPAPSANDPSSCRFASETRSVDRNHSGPDQYFGADSPSRRN